MSSSNNPGSSSSSGKTVTPDDVTNLRRPRQSGSDSPGQGTGIETDPDTIHAEGQSIGGMNQLTQAEEAVRAGTGGTTGNKQGGSSWATGSGTIQSTQSDPDQDAPTSRTGQKKTDQPTSGSTSSSDDRGGRGQNQKTAESTT